MKLTKRQLEFLGSGDGSGPLKVRGKGDHTVAWSLVRKHVLYWNAADNRFYFRRGKRRFCRSALRQQARERVITAARDLCSVDDLAAADPHRWDELQAALRDAGISLAPKFDPERKST